MTSLAVNNSIYCASWPKTIEPTCATKIFNCAWNVFSLVCFPVGVARLLNHHVIRPYAIKNLLLPAINSFEGCRVNKKYRGSFKMANGKKIEGLFCQRLKHSDKLVIYCSGNGGLPSKKYLPRVLKGSGASVLAVNYPGVAGSKGFPAANGLNLEESLALPVYSAFEYAVKKLNVAKENVLLYGFSIGGAAATIGASYIESRYGKDAVKLISDRSFSSLSTLAVAYVSLIKETIRKMPNQKTSVRGRVIKWVILNVPDFFVRAAVHLTGLEINAESAFKKLKTKNKCVIYAEKDQMIPYKAGATLYQGVQKVVDFFAIKLSNMHGHVTDFQGHSNTLVRERIHEFFY
ncbi:MAG: hypothetical protein V4494_01560 [Chlamydiota bacterium]